MTETRAIPIGIEDFKKIREGNYFFADKSLLIKDVLDSSTVSLFTRPRRFGKTLNMSMLRYFFEKSDTDNSYLFDDLKIAGVGDKYLSHMGKYPVISISMKSMQKDTYEESINVFRYLISDEYERHQDILKSDSLPLRKRKQFENILTGTADNLAYADSIRILTDCLYKVYGVKAVVLIDEYDVPLQAAKSQGYYDKMVSFIRSLFSGALKTNDSLAFGVLTGCLRVSKESIFTGLNNLAVYPLTSNLCSSYFGFTEAEVKEILEAYNISERFADIRDWYDGYIFGSTEIYNPWSVLNYVNEALACSNSLPDTYWVNTSSNSIIRDILERSSYEVRNDIETLIDGKSITKKLYTSITYSDIDMKSETIWSLLLHTGYLKPIRVFLDDVERKADLIIPNKEVLTIYRDTISEWLNHHIHTDGTTALFNAILRGDSENFEIEVRRWLKRSISYNNTKESYYHGFLAGLLMGYEDFEVDSNYESGDGRSDIRIFDSSTKNVAIIIEVKRAENDLCLNEKADEALLQITEKKYSDYFIARGYKRIIKYGTAFYKKDCCVKIG